MMTILRSLHLLPIPAVELIRVVGLDVFAWKRGTGYDTVILDLKTPPLIDVLPDCEAESVKSNTLRNVLDDVEPVDRKDENQDRRANDKRPKPAALECELLLVVLD